MSQDLSVRKFLLGIFDDESRVVEAVKALRDAGIPIHDVYTPYAVHGLDEGMGIRRSRLPLVCFFAGGAGLLFAILFQIWVFTESWPINFGGKPFLSVPAFIPVTFEVTVLVSGLVTVAAFLFRSKLFPGTDAKLLDRSITDDGFVIAIERADASLNAEAAGKILKRQGAKTVREGEVLS